VISLVRCKGCLEHVDESNIGRVVCEADEGGEPEQVGVLCAACVADEAAQARHEHECDLAAAKAQTEAYAELYFADPPTPRLLWSFAGRNADLRAHLSAN
jgi:predicted GNAT family N-acyltransferase